MRTLAIIIASTLILAAFNFKSNPLFRFAEVVKIEGITDLKGVEACTGVVKNYLGFNFYQLDKVWCDGFAHDSVIVSEPKMKLLVLETPCSTGTCYTPLLGGLSIPENAGCRKPIHALYFENLCPWKVFYEENGQHIFFTNL